MVLVDPHPQARERWERMWNVLSRCTERDEQGRAVVLDRPGGRPAALWPYSQALHAAVLVAHMHGEDEPVGSFGRGLEAYRRGTAYQSRPRRLPARRYYDDNAWVGLAASHAALLGVPGSAGAPLASRLADWVATGEAAGSGVHWREGSTGVHACSTGAAGVLALRAPGVDDAAVAFATRCADFLMGPLRLPSGLVADNRTHGRVDPTVWSYNQGLAIGLLTLLSAAGGEPWWDQARDLADACVTYLGVRDRLWRQPPCFVGVLGRMLLLLHAHDGELRWVDVVDGYLDRVWVRTSADDFTGSGLGSYDRERTLDLAGLTTLQALRALPGEELRKVC